MTSPIDPRAHAVTLAVWDVDRTLTRHDTLIPFLRQVVGAAQWHTTLHQVLAEAVAHGASRAALKAGLLRRCLAGRDYVEVEAVARDFATAVQQQKCRLDAVQRWNWHRARGHCMVLASASPELYVRPLAELLGAQQVLATGLMVEDGRFTGAMSTANCRGVEKARRIRDLIESSGPATVWFYSDSRSDRPSANLAHFAIRVRPWRRITAPNRQSQLLLSAPPLGGAR